MYLLKHMALKSAVVKGTSGGYRISISGLSNPQYITPKTWHSDDLPDINIEVTDYAADVSTRHSGDKQDLQSHGPVLEPACRDRRDLGFPQFLHVILSPRATVGVQEFILELFHVDAGRT